MTKAVTGDNGCPRGHGCDLKRHGDKGCYGDLRSHFECDFNSHCDLKHYGDKGCRAVKCVGVALRGMGGACVY